MGDDESQIIELLEHKSKCINTIDDKWIAEWAALIEKYFKLETRNHIRLKAIALLSQIFSKYHVICEDELMNKIILPYFSDVDQENDSVVKKPIVHLLFDVASACLSYKYCNAILAIVRKILNKPFKHKSEETNGLVYIIGNVDIIDSRLIISNLNKLFNSKLYRLPIDPAVNMLDISVNYLNLTYKCPLQDPTPAEIPMIRRELFLLFLNLRCNKHGHLGVLTPQHQQQPTSQQQQQQPPPPPPTTPQQTPSQQHQHQHHYHQHQPPNLSTGHYPYQTTNNTNPLYHQYKKDVKYSPFIICVKRPRTADQLPSPLPPDSPTQLNSPTSTTGSMVNQFYPTTSGNHPILAPHNHNFHQNNHQNIFVSNASQPNCPIVSRCVTLDAMFAGIIECINQETDSDVLKLVLDGLPGLLANKPLVLSATQERINQLCVALGELTKSTRICKQNCKFDIVQCGLRCLTSLLIYRKILDHKSIKVMLAAFEDSLKLVSRQTIVPLFTTCLIELHDSSEMTRFLPVVLNRLSKFSPTLNLGIGMLEFLSYLILFPKLYENFSEDEYKFIFAIALPYTNIFRFSDYIACLAFRVIAMWYLNCRPSLRSAFVDFVKKSLQSNVIQPFKENYSGPLYSPQAASFIMQTPPPLTYPSPTTMSPVDQRKRSSSLNTETCFRTQQTASCLSNSQLSLQVNEELVETFADLLSRYTHGQCLAIAPKNRCIELLVDRSTSQTWLHGNSLVTVTSGRSSHGWAEIMIRRPTGNTSWVGRLQNTLGALPPIMNQQVYLDSLNFGNDVISLFSTMRLGGFAAAYCSDGCSDGGLGGNGDDLSESGEHQSLSSSVTPGTALSFASLSGVPYTVVNTNPSASSHQSASTLSAATAAAAAAAAAASSSSSSKLLDPILLPKDQKFDIALSNFDHITPYETHKVGVVYVAKNQVESRTSILSNTCGSPRYYEFLSNIGTCIILNDIDPEIYFIGGLDTKGDDGKYAYFWKDNVTQVIFHVATCMPARENDPQCNNKNRHIGNNHVCIVYNDSKEPFHMSTIKGVGQVIMACIVVTPLEDVTNIVEVEVLPEISRNILGEIEPRVLSNLGASLYARQMAIHLNLASKIYERARRSRCQTEAMLKEPYVSNWVERLRCIKRIRQRLDESRKMSSSGANSITRGGSNSMK